MSLAQRSQPRILAEPGSPALFLTLRALPVSDLRPALERLAAAVDLDHAVLGLGAPLVAALVDGPDGQGGASFVSVQRWIHDSDAPESAHIRRTVQEKMGFLLRRSMPWGSVAEHGLAFVANAADPDVFLGQLERMAGKADGIVDGINRFSRAVSGGLYGCPPVQDGALDMRVLGGSL